MRTYTKIFLLAALVAVFALTTGLSNAVAEDKKPEFKWRVQTVHAPAETQRMIRPMLDEIEAASGGRIKFELYSSGELVSDDQMLPAVQRGTIDMIDGLAPNEASPVDIAPLDGWPPFGWSSPVEIHNIYWNRGMRELYNQAYEELGNIKVVGIKTTDPLHMFSTKPINSYEDFKGLKISTDNIVATPFIDAGAVTVNLPVSEFYLSGQTGIVDALAWCGAKEAYSNSWYEVFPYMLSNRIAGCTLTHWIANEKAWNKLPKDLQDLVTMGLKAGALKAILYYYDDEPKHRKYFKMTTLSEEDWAKVKASQEKRYDEIAKISERCAKLVQIYRDYNKEVQELGWYRCKGE